MEKPDRLPQIHPDQMSIGVPDAPNAIARLSEEDQFRIYAEIMGEDAAERQRKLAEELNRCTCGAEQQEKHKARQEDRKVRRLRGYDHKPPCPKVRPRPERRGLSDEAMQELYEKMMQKGRAA